MIKTKKLDSFLSKWKGAEFQSSTVKTEQFKAFARGFKSVVKEQLEGRNLELSSYSVGHFDVSGFIRTIGTEERYAYFSVSDVRHFSDEWANHILLRTAAHLKDYSGGKNNYTSLDSFGEQVDSLLERV